MSLNWSFPDNANRDRPRLEQMIFATIPVGINRITESNYKKFYSRYRQLQLATGRTGADIALADVKDHIGLSTNASTITDAQFKKTLTRYLEEKAERIIAVEEKGGRPAVTDWHDKHRAEVAVADKWNLTREYSARIVDLVCTEICGLPVEGFEEQE